MIRWFQRWLADRRRLIFKFYDGSRYRSADPIVVSDRLLDDPDYLPRHLSEAFTGDRKAIEICVAATDRAFDLVKDSLTIAERLELLRRFDYWLQTLKKNTRHSVD